MEAQIRSITAKKLDLKKVYPNKLKKRIFVMQRLLFLFFVIQLCFSFSWQILAQGVDIKDSLINSQIELIEAYDQVYKAQEKQIESLQNFTDTLFVVNISIVAIIFIALILIASGTIDKYLYK